MFIIFLSIFYYIKMNPTFIEKYLIYDVFYNDLNQYVLISPKINNYNISINIKNNTYNLKLISCAHNHTNVYISNELEYESIIDIIINNDTCKNVKVNKYSNFSNKILMSTIVKNEDNYICQWIEYHKFLGVQHFIIYDNSSSNTLSKVLKKYIDENVVILINWQYPYYFYHSGISGQTTQQNHSIYAFKTAKYIGLMDIDEYVNPQIGKNINDYFNDLIKNNNIDINNIGGFELVSRFFINKQNKPVDKYNFLKNKKTTSIHVRRGDYVNHPNHHPTQSLEYYLEAIKILKDETELFLVFSDDINWCKENIKLDNVVYIENEKDYIELYLMSVCTNNIISNSSFSWWGAWLNKNEDKKVIGPLKWFGDAIKHNTGDVLPENWIKL